MAPNTSSLFNGAHPPPQPAADAKGPSDGVLVAQPPAEPAVVASVSAVSVTSAASAATTSAAAPAAAAVAMAVEPPSNRQFDMSAFDDCDEEAVAAAAERQFQMSRFARVSPAALDGVRPPLGYRKSCLKRSNSALPADLSILKQEAEAAAAAPREPPVPELPAKPVQKNRRRCWECKAKVALTAVTCRCDYTFCNKHRYAEEHKCTFDFKVSAKRKLEAENPRVVPSKVARIN